MFSLGVRCCRADVTIYGDPEAPPRARRKTGAEQLFSLRFFPPRARINLFLPVSLHHNVSRAQRPHGPFVRDNPRGWEVTCRGRYNDDNLSARHIAGNRVVHNTSLTPEKAILNIRMKSDGSFHHPAQTEMLSDDANSDASVVVMYAKYMISHFIFYSV